MLMCGIAGAVGFVNREIARAVCAMDAAQSHRGPDGRGYWSSMDERCGEASHEDCGAVLAHRRLAILDLSEAGAQPMIDPSSGAVIVYNGEVYNFMEIRRELETTGEIFVSHGDTEVVLRAIMKWGIGTVRKFRGMFALAVWEPTTRRLHLARDRVGIKPLYVAEVGGGSQRTLIFASELRAILNSGLVERRIDPSGLSTYLWNGFVHGPYTMVRGVRLVPAGTTMTIVAGQPAAEPQRYWSLPCSPVSYRVEAVDELSHELQTAVKLRLISDVPLGIFLSGGIDSSAIAALATKCATSPVHTFTIGFDDPAYDESRYAEAVANSLGTRHTCLHLTEGMFTQRLERALRSVDQPTFDGINTYFVSQAVREAGITVALAGTGGDELFGGYSSYEDLPRVVTWSRALRHVPVGLVRSMGDVVSRLQTGGRETLPAQTRWGKVADALLCRGDLVKLYQVAYAMFTVRFLGELSQYLRESMHGTGGALDVCHGLPLATYRTLLRQIDGSPIHHAIATLELSAYIGQRLMRDTDAASMAVALEARVPLLDHRVIECVSAVAPMQRFMPLRRKRLLQHLALDRLDAGLFDRPKAGFVLPIDRWCRQSLRGQVDEVLHDTRLCQAAGIYPPAVARLARAFQSGQPGIYWTRLWMLYVLLWWCQEYHVTL
jgi:asparagine synthase (glutamine-hydrolysing)